MRKLFILAALIILNSSSLFAQAEMVQKNILNDSISLLLPAGFHVWEDKNYLQAGFFTDPSGDALLSYRFDTDSITDNEIPAYTDIMLKQAKLDNRDYKYIDDGIHLQDGKNIGYIKYSTKNDGRKAFNSVFYISYGDKALLFHFTCPLRQRKKWEADIDAIANSLRIKQ
ncbi:MAG: hypothetical protein QM687_06525 [Ferruginibacter sp.]